MREASRDKGRLEHIAECIDNIEQFSAGVTFEQLVQNKQLRHALTWNIQVIGEASNFLTKEFRNEHPQTDWRAIIGMRNVLVHDYYQIDEEELWEVIQADIPPLKQQIEQYLSEVE